MESNPMTKGFIDPEKCSGLPLEEKMQLVREIAQWNDAPDILSSFSRKDLLELICAEMGKERKYSGVTKPKMIEHLLKLISKSMKRKEADNALELSPAKSQTGVKKLRKTENLVQMPTYQEPVCGFNITKTEVKTLLCANLACRAALSADDGFCKRCSCCICHRYDDNKDPSLWLTCDSDVSDGYDSCGMSCHLKCAFKHERTGIAKNSKCGKLDGRFCCVSCSKVNDLMSIWRKQLLVAKEARRVDALCLRISWAHKLLDGTERYRDLHKSVDLAAKKLKKELGPLDRVCERMGRGIVNRLACGAEVQKLCSSALEAFDVLFSLSHTGTSTQKSSSTCRIRFEESFPTSVVIILEYDNQQFSEYLGCRIWHRKSTAKEYPEKPTCIVLRPEKKFKITELKQCTEYICKVSLFSCTTVFGTWEAVWLTPPSIGMYGSVVDERDGTVDESPVQLFQTLSDCNKSASSDHTGKLRSLNDINATHIVSAESIPTTPIKVDGRHDFVAPSKIRHVEVNGSYEYCVGVIKCLERDGHLDVDFRVKFLTWFSLKATMQDRRVVGAFVDTMADDPPSLAEQLIDAFADEVGSERGSCSTRIFPEVFL